MNVVLSIFLAIIATEAIVQLIIHSEFFRPLRDFLIARSIFLGTLVSCGYCMSVWVGFGVAFLTCPLSWPYTHYWTNFLVWGLFIHRASNILDDIIDKFLPSSMPVLDAIETVPESPSFEEADIKFGIEQDRCDATDISLNNLE